VADRLERSAIALSVFLLLDLPITSHVFMHEFHLRNLSIEFLRQPFLIQTCTLTGPSFLLLYSKRSILPRIGSDTFFIVGPHIRRISAGIALDRTPSDDTHLLQPSTDLTLKNSLTTSASLPLPSLSNLHSPSSTLNPLTNSAVVVCVAACKLR
jgi:hypothetical protein